MSTTISATRRTDAQIRSIAFEFGRQKERASVRLDVVRPGERTSRAVRATLGKRGMRTSGAGLAAAPGPLGELAAYLLGTAAERAGTTLDTLEAELAPAGVRPCELEIGGRASRPSVRLRLAVRTSDGGSVPGYLASEGGEGVILLPGGMRMLDGSSAGRDATERALVSEEPALRSLATELLSLVPEEWRAA